MKNKLLKSISISDLELSPIWEHWIEDDIEYVKPVYKEGISEEDIIDYIVLTEFVFNNNNRYQGFCSPKDTSGIDYIQPVVIINNQQLEFYSDTRKNMDIQGKILKQFGLSKNEIFPLIYKTKVKCDGGFLSGKIIEFNRQE